MIKFDLFVPVVDCREDEGIPGSELHSVRQGPALAPNIYNSVSFLIKLQFSMTAERWHNKKNAFLWSEAPHPHIGSCLFMYFFLLWRKNLLVQWNTVHFIKSYQSVKLRLLFSMTEWPNKNIWITSFNIFLLNHNLLFLSFVYLLFK